MPSINTAYQWCINACNAPNIGYSQIYRRGQTVNGITYYDCSSFISQALTISGFYSINPWFTTFTMRNYLTQAGFTEYNPREIAWAPGDILLTVSGEHTEMCYTGGAVGKGGITMGAHTDSVPLSEQVSINISPTPASYYEYLYRYGNTPAIPVEWVSSNAYLGETDMQNNAYVFYSIMANKGYTLNAISGMLGNMQRESTINPGIWQNLDEGNYSLGFGLVQWTPATNYTNWATVNGYEIGDGDGQCVWLDAMTVSSGQWIVTSDYNMSWDEFKVSTESPEYLASAFLKNFERAGAEYEEERRANARKWYNYLKNMTPFPPTPDTPKRKMPLWMYLTF